MLFLHKEIHFIQGVETRTVFFLVVAEGFQQADHCNSALVLYSITHGGFLRHKNTDLLDRSV
jgi:hypothetical protein